MAEYVGRNFVTTLHEGNRTEAVIRDLFLREGYIVGDCSGIPEYQEKDIDFIAENPNTGVRISYEVKSDNRIADTGNVALEMYMLRHSGLRKGWYEYCQADYIVYCDAMNRVAYFIHWKSLKADIESGKFDKYQQRQFNNTIDNCVGCVRLVKLEDLCQKQYVKFVSQY